MFPTARLTAFLSLVLVASATPIASSTSTQSGTAQLQITKHLNSKQGSSPVKSDQARIAAIIGRGKPTKNKSTVSDAKASANGTAGSAPITDQAIIYTAPIGVGSQTFNVIVDTGR